MATHLVQQKHVLREELLRILARGVLGEGADGRTARAGAQ